MPQNKPFLPHWFKYIDLESKRQFNAELFKDGSFRIYERETIRGQDQNIAIFLDGVFHPTTTGAAYYFMNLLVGLAGSPLNVFLFRCYRGWEDPYIYEKLPFSTVCIDPEVFYDDLTSQIDVLRKYSIRTLIFDTSEVILRQGVYFKETLKSKIIHDIQNVDHVLSKMGGLSPDVVEKQKQELLAADKYVDLYWAKTEMDKVQLQNVGIDPHKIRVRHPIIDTKRIRYSLRKKLGNPVKALFLGNMSYPPNIEGLEVLENTYKDCVTNGIRLEIDVVGEGDLATLAEKFPHLNLKGKVDSINDLFLDYHLAFACPSYGSGISLKVLDYMAAGLPVIANDIGVRGHSQLISNYVLIDNRESLYPAVQRLFENPEFYTRLSSSSRVYIDKYFNPEKDIRTFEDDIREINLCP